jgi:hypothetical protein
MATTGGTETASKIGGRPTAAVRSGCGGCGHPHALHSNGRTACKAWACRTGPNGKPCQGFEPARVHQAALVTV